MNEVKKIAFKIFFHVQSIRKYVILITALINIRTVVFKTSCLLYEYVVRYEYITTWSEYGSRNGRN